jgi:uncharacterized membrane protein
VFLSGVLYEAAHHLVGGVTMGEAFVARWLMAWGDAFLTGMLVAIFVAFRPEWLATWSDQRYLVEPPAPVDDEPQPDSTAPSAVTLPPDRPTPPP